MSEHDSIFPPRPTTWVLVVMLTVLSTHTVLAQDRVGWPAIDVSRMQAAPVAGAQPQWGTVDATIHALNAWDFQKIDETQIWSFTPGALYRHRTSASTSPVIAGFHLPTGARLTGMAIEACDTSVTGAVVMVLNQCAAGSAASCVFTTFLTTGNAPAPGCAIYSVDLTASNIVIDNVANSYSLSVATATMDNTTAFRGVRLFYKLQVSPAPLVATFPNDVPTSHPFFQFVEALARAGITGGCAAGSYCPDQAVTRGQMAVFLSAALGLHWPN